MYIRTKGMPFTVKNKEEKKEIIDQINSDKEVTKFFQCIGLDLEQFTGKINFALFKLGNRLVKYDVSGKFPTLVLSSDQSSNIYQIEFPVEKKTVIEETKKVSVTKKENSVNSVIEVPTAENEKIAVEESKPIVIQEIVPVEKPEDKPVQIIDEPVKEEEILTAENEVHQEETSDSAVEEEPKEEEKVETHRKTRKKKQLSV